MKFSKMERARRVTIRDLARRAGLSVSTVSMALNNHTRVKEETRQRVRLLADEMNFVPNVSARALSRSRTNLIGVIIESVMKSFFPELLQGIEDVLFETDFNPIICYTRGDPEKERIYFTRLMDKQVDGIIYLPPLPGAGISEQLRQVQSAGIPMLSIIRRQTEVEVPYVVVDNQQGGYLATRHLLELGHRRIGHLAAPSWLPISQDRLEGYRQALGEWGLEFQPDWVEESGDFTWEDGMRSMRRLLFRAENLTAVFVASDLVAIGASYAARNLGLRIPSDISLVGFDGLEVGEYAEVPLTTVAQPRYEIGVNAAEMLLALIEGQPIESKNLMNSLLVRASTCPPRMV